ncbi:universal stress protein [Streptomyces sp. R-07]|uniref:universal stress protein n=1 Tax=Streptomyces sp. R-07 TaxID=3404052 RepID=UPI003CF5CD70
MSVVLGCDESPGAARAPRIAVEVAAAFDERLVLVDGAAAPGPVGEEWASPYQAVRQAGRAGLEHAVTEADRAGVPTVPEVIDDQPAPGLIDAATRHAARITREPAVRARTPAAGTDAAGRTDSGGGNCDRPWLTGGSSPRRTGTG